MSEQHGAVVMIRSKRGKLLAYGVTAVLIGGGAGWLLETSGLFATSPLGRLGAPSGLPVVAIAVAGMATVVAFFILRDSWNHTITLDGSEMRIRDNLGEYALPYSNIREVKTVPQGAVVLGLHDPERWLASASGDRGIRERTAAVINRHYGGHLLFADSHLSFGAAKFVSLIQERTKAGTVPG